jgi:superoxide dismutase
MARLVHQVAAAGTVALEPVLAACREQTLDTCTTRTATFFHLIALSELTNTQKGFDRQFGTPKPCMADHMHSPAMTAPLLVMDVYETYHIDFGAAAAQYVDAFLNNINWESLLARIEAL